MLFNCDTISALNTMSAIAKRTVDYRPSYFKILIKNSPPCTRRACPRTVDCPRRCRRTASDASSSGQAAKVWLDLK